MSDFAEPQACRCTVLLAQVTHCDLQATLQIVWVQSMLGPTQSYHCKHSMQSARSCTSPDMSGNAPLVNNCIILMHGCQLCIQARLTRLLTCLASETSKSGNVSEIA